jgi:hypothetical protein
MRAKVRRTARRNERGMVISRKDGIMARNNRDTEARETPLPITRSVSLRSRLKSTMKVKRVRLKKKFITVSRAIYV